MDEELDRIRREADGVASTNTGAASACSGHLLGASLAGLTALVMAMIDGQKNPCARVQSTCARKPAGWQCKAYAGIVDDRERGAPRCGRRFEQCQSKIERLQVRGGSSQVRGA